MASEVFELTLKLQPVASFSTVQGVQEAVQFEGLVDGTDCNLDGDCSNVEALATGTSVDMFSEGCDELDAVIGGDCSELGVHIMEGCYEALPMVPVILPLSL